MRVFAVSFTFGGFKLGLGFGFGFIEGEERDTPEWKQATTRGERECRNSRAEREFGDRL